MKALLKKHASKLRFALVGTVNTTIDFGLLFILVAIGLGKIPSNYIATTAAFVFSFFANRSYTFKSTGNIRRQIALFSGVTLFGLWIIQPIIITVATDGLDNLNISNEISLLISKILATGVTLVWNYVLYSKIVFKG
jgi:putative flippase GtrA